MNKKAVLLIMFLLLVPGSGYSSGFPLIVVDSDMQEITLAAAPGRVVSLVPSVTEILFAIGAGEKVIGTTYHFTGAAEAEKPCVVGGFFNPDLERVAELQPDVIFYSSLHREVPDRFSKTATLIRLAPNSIEEGFEHIRLLGRMFDRQVEAEKIMKEQQRLLQMISEKSAKIPAEKRLRVMRLMGRDRIMTPGDDSFQNEYIRAAGGIAPTFGRIGNVIDVDLSQWREFNPQVLYGCGDDRTLRPLLDRPGWRDVDAVRNNRILFFPCELTCRASTGMGRFVSWLSARLYREQYGDPAQFVLPQATVEERPLELGIDYVERAAVVESDIKDFRNKTLVVSFKHPMWVFSTLEGQREGISTVANHYFPPPSWGLGHEQGLGPLRRSTLDVLGLDETDTSILFTGANMDNLAVVKKVFREMEVTALVTAGVNGNSVRMGKDSGNFYEPVRAETKGPGTINILILSNMELTSRAMARAVINVTEAKTAALQDLDIRSTYSGKTNQATGTGTDNIIVVQGEGYRIDSTGGHTKIGELIASAVYEGVQEAVARQNGLKKDRTVFQRLRERKVDLHALCRLWSPAQPTELYREVERILLKPHYAGFIQSILAMSDAHEQGLLTNVAGLSAWTTQVAGEIAGSPVMVKQTLPEELPPIIAKGVVAIIAGAEARLKKKNTPLRPKNCRSVNDMSPEVWGSDGRNRGRHIL